MPQRVLDVNRSVQHDSKLWVQQRLHPFSYLLLKSGWKCSPYQERWLACFPGRDLSKEKSVRLNWSTRGQGVSGRNPTPRHSRRRRRRRPVKYKTQVQGQLSTASVERKRTMMQYMHGRESTMACGFRIPLRQPMACNWSPSPYPKEPPSSWTPSIQHRSLALSTEKKQAVDATQNASGIATTETQLKSLWTTSGTGNSKRAWSVTTKRWLKPIGLPWSKFGTTLRPWWFFVICFLHSNLVISNFNHMITSRRDLWRGGLEAMESPQTASASSKFVERFK